MGLHGVTSLLTARASAVTTNVRGVDVESGALVGRTQDGDQEVEDEGAVWTASRTRTPRAVFLAHRTA
jgi:hypothetical protein